jgi:hypothetical protein
MMQRWIVQCSSLEFVGDARANELMQNGLLGSDRRAQAKGTFNDDCWILF